jgi:hypothetical protein
MLEAHRDPHEKLVVLTVETGLLAEILETTRSSYGCLFRSSGCGVDPLCAADPASLPEAGFARNSWAGNF